MPAQPDDAKSVVLVVEHESILRFYAVDWLEDAGFAVVDVRTAAEALTVLEARSDIRLVFSDIDLPDGVDGVRLLRQVRERWPPVALVVTSGRFKPEYLELPVGCRFFGKPYRPAEVAQTMHRMLAYDA